MPEVGREVHLVSLHAIFLMLHTIYPLAVNLFGSGYAGLGISIQAIEFQ